MDTKVISSRATTWFVLCSVVAMLYFAREFLLPVAMAILIAFAFAPFVRRLEKLGLPRAAATLLTMFGVALVLGGLLWVLTDQVRGFIEDLPQYRDNVRAKSADVRATFQDAFGRASETVRDIGNEIANGDAPKPAATKPVPVAPPAMPESASFGLPAGVGSMVEYAGVFGLVILLAVLLLMRWEDLRDRVLALAGENELQVTTRAANEASDRVGLFLRRQLLVNAIHGTAVGLILWWIGVPNPLVWGLLGAVMRFIPYLGPTIALVAPVLVSFASSSGWTETWITLGSLLGLEIITNNVLEVWFYGVSTGISPFALLVSTAFWTWIWGAGGLVLATPLTVCLLVLGKRFPRLRFLDIVFREEPALSQPSRLYHRLLANSPYEAWEILRDETARGTLADAADRALVPALGLAGVAHVEGRIDVETRERIGVLANGLVDEIDEPPRDPVAAPSNLRVLCIPARDAFDQIGVRVLVGSLARQGIEATASSPDRMLAEVLERLREGRYDVVVLSSVVPTHFLHVRSLCKRLLAAGDDFEILVGLWGEDLPPAETQRRLPDSPRIHLATSLAQAVAWCEEASTRKAPVRIATAASA